MINIITNVSIKTLPALRVRSAVDIVAQVDRGHLTPADLGRVEVCWENCSGGVLHSRYPQHREGLISPWAVHAVGAAGKSLECMIASRKSHCNILVCLMCHARITLECVENIVQTQRTSTAVGRKLTETHFDVRAHELSVRETIRIIFGFK